MPSINTLAVNLSISESRSHRQELANQILSQVELFQEKLPIEKHLKRCLVDVVQKCVINPMSKSREDLFQLAALFQEKLESNELNPDVAA